MAIGINVKDGTHAGWRVAREAYSDYTYTCPVREGGCGKVVKYFWTKCPNCGHPRPER